MRSGRLKTITLVALAYAAAGRIMLAPIFNFNHLASASYGGDARAFIWTLAWDNHAVLARVPSLFNANKLYPLPNALAYGEHLFGISLFTLPIYALTHNPVLAYNIAWLLAYALAAPAIHLLAWRYTCDQLASLEVGRADFIADEQRGSRFELYVAQVCGVRGRRHELEPAVARRFDFPRIE